MPSKPLTIRVDLLGPGIPRRIETTVDLDDLGNALDTLRDVMSRVTSVMVMTRHGHDYACHASQTLGDTSCDA